MVVVRLAARVADIAACIAVAIILEATHEMHTIDAVFCRLEVGLAARGTDIALDRFFLWHADMLWFWF